MPSVIIYDLLLLMFLLYRQVFSSWEPMFVLPDDKTELSYGLRKSLSNVLLDLEGPNAGQSYWVKGRLNTHLMKFLRTLLLIVVLS